MKKNEMIFYIKGLSIISVICAHCNAVPDTAPYFPRICSLILQNIGTGGGDLLFYYLWLSFSL